MFHGDVKELNFESKVVHGSKGCDPETGAISYPIYQSATFRHPGLNRSTGYDYSRVQNPTREELENTIAELENGRHGFAFSSGMAAISAVLSMFSPGGHLLVSDDLYGGTYRLFEEVYKRYGIDFSYVDTSDINEVKSGLKDNTKAIFIETPSNPMMKVTDLLSVCGIAKGKGILTIVDNTFLTPYYQKPLELGADLVLHSGTKYLAGHNDTLAGLVVVKDEGLAEKLAFIQKSTGAVLGPFDSWLVLRGIKTLAVRLDRQQQNAMKIAQWLRNHDEIETVYYAGLPDHQDYDVSLRQSTGFGGMLSFTVKRIELIERMLERLKLVLYAESLGGVESLITYPSVQTHAAIPDEIRNRIGVNDRLLRLSVGIENVDDIINDLEQAMK